MLARDPWDDPREFYCVVHSLDDQERHRMLGRLDAHIEDNPDSACALFSRGLLHMALGERRRAEMDFSSVVNLSPGDAEAHTHRGFARARWGRTDRQWRTTT